MAMTIISQSLCLRSNFIINGRRLAVAELSRKSVAAALRAAPLETYTLVRFAQRSGYRLLAVS